ncbi:transcriptional adapter 1-like [Dendronephthya gigantea]|uniref:transcriptional adapter 1-like n=1 Tax=Dendronephthya gigantea TaxID=151771 RepID=UPI00106D6405|nr:transcriptional adapter 1-like [Dendronephthya gigantea]
MADLQEAREQLMEVLGDLASKYWTTLSLWYKKKLSKEEFDIQIGQLLGEGNLNVHNRFLYALLSKCQEMCLTSGTPNKNLSRPSVTSVASQRNTEHIRKHVRPAKVNFEQRFQPYSVLEGADNVGKVVLTDDSEISLCSYEFTLPDVQAMNGRLFLGAWDAGLESVEDLGSNAAKLVISAVKHHIKDILTACCSRKGGFRLRDGHFKYGLDTSYVKPHIWNSLDSYSPHSFLLHQGQTELTEADAAITVASSHHPTSHTSISTYELREVLQVHCRVIPSHTVYAANMERILSRLWHPSHDEIEQERLHRLEAKRRQSKLRQQRSLRL